MSKLIWNRCPKHRMDMTRDYDDESIPFYYCPICGFFRYHDGREGYNSKLILENKGGYELDNTKNSDNYPLCPQCKANYLTPFEKNGWYCSRCKYRS